MSRLAAWQAAVVVLRETGNPAGMFGDSGLLHQIAERLGWPHESWRTEQRVMAALNRTPGQLIKYKTALLNGRVVSGFRLPESRLRESAGWRQLELFPEGDTHADR